MMHFKTAAAVTLNNIENKKEVKLDNTGIMSGKAFIEHILAQIRGAKSGAVVA